MINALKKGVAPVRIVDPIVDEHSPHFVAGEKSVHDKGWEPFHTRQFENELFDLMERFHGVRRHNDIVRNGKSARGFKHVALTVEDAK